MDSTKEEANQPIQQLKLISALESFVENYLSNRPVVKKDDNAGWRGIFDGPNVEVYRKEFRNTNWEADNFANFTALSQKSADFLVKSHLFRLLSQNLMQRVHLIQRF